MRIMRHSTHYYYSLYQYSAASVQSTKQHNKMYHIFLVQCGERCRSPSLRYGSLVKPPHYEITIYPTSEHFYILRHLTYTQHQYWYIKCLVSFRIMSPWTRCLHQSLDLIEYFLILTNASGCLSKSIRIFSHNVICLLVFYVRLSHSGSLLQHSCLLEQEVVSNIFLHFVCFI